MRAFEHVREAAADAGILIVGRQISECLSAERLDEHAVAAVSEQAFLVFAFPGEVSHLVAGHFKAARRGVGRRNAGLQVQRGRAVDFFDARVDQGDQLADEILRESKKAD